MAVKIEEPRIDQANLDDWHAIIARTREQGGGFICLELTHIDDSSRPEIAEGSRFEMNGVFYRVGPGNEEIQGDPDTQAHNENNYIYAEKGEDYEIQGKLVAIERKPGKR